MVYVGNARKKEYLVSIIVFSILQFLYVLCIGTLWQKGYWRFQKKSEYGFDISAESRMSYEPKPKEYIYDEDEELLDKKNDEKLPENFWDKKDFSIRKKCLAYWNVFWKAL
ncbi:21073_t:CDS:2 [Entrophospora sp. SA101]|nr:21069_t:CDS:2 [Entrophospora sp. SA101]CAJ0859319.1 21073_t:CDS:2 [Entrophospora sp. SA101]